MSPRDRVQLCKGCKVVRFMCKLCLCEGMPCVLRTS